MLKLGKIPGKPGRVGHPATNSVLQTIAVLTQMISVPGETQGCSQASRKGSTQLKWSEIDSSIDVIIYVLRPGDQEMLSLKRRDVSF